MEKWPSSTQTVKILKLYLAVKIYIYTLHLDKIKKKVLDILKLLIIYNVRENYGNKKTNKI